MGNYVSLSERASGLGGSTSPFDKDIELLKINIVAEELRGSFYTLFGAYFSFLIAILGAIVVVTTFPDVATKLQWLGILPAFGVVVFLYAENTAMKHRRHIVEVDKLIEKVESQNSIGKIRDVMDDIRKRV